MSQAAVLVLAAPGVGGAQLAATIAAGGGRAAAVFDEVADEPLGDEAAGRSLRTACRDLLWRRERDWTCPPATLEVDDADRELAAGVVELLREGAVVFDVALPACLPALLHDLADDTAVHVVVAVRQPAGALPALLCGHDLDEDHADDLLRTVTARLAALAADVPVTVVDLEDPDAAATVAATVAGGTVEVLLPLPDVDPVASVEPDPAVDQLRARTTGDEPRARTTGDRDTDVGTLRAALAGLASVPDALDRHAGPRTAARRAVLRGLATTGGPWGHVLECTRATGPGVWSGRDDDLEVVHVDGIGQLRRNLEREPTSVTTLVFSDLTSWCDGAQLRTALELSLQVVASAGTVAVGRSPADDAARRRAGLPPLADDEVVEAGRGLGLVPLPVRGAGELRVLPFTAHAAVARTVDDLRREVDSLRTTAEEQRAKASHFRDRSDDLTGRVEQLEARVTRAVAQRDDARARYDELRGRRVVRIVLGIVDRVGVLLRRVRGRG